MMKKFSLSALVAAGLLVGGLSAGSASAADLGGNCCADLEERIAELEATTARKGNRKVSLTVSGWVGEQVMYWDDGSEQNVYVTGLGSTLASHFKFTGQATISPGWSAGYVIHVEAMDSDSLTLNQFSQHNTSALGCQRRLRRAAACSPTGSSRATTSANSASACSRPPRITLRSWSTARARSFLRTG